MEINRVKFQKPDAGELSSKGFTCVDMHMHSQYSDTYTRISNILKRASKMGIGVSVTDHNEIRGAVEAYKKRGSILVIPGIEVNCSEGAHVLFYFYRIKDLEEFHKKEVEKYKNSNPYTFTKRKTESLIEKSKDYNSIVCLAHPFAPGLNIFNHIKNNDFSKGVLKNVDLVEVICGQGFRNMNLKALEWASDIDKGFTGGSDAHTLRNVGTVLTCSKDTSSISSFLGSLKKKKNCVVGNESRIWNRALAYSKVTNRHLRYIAPTIRLNYNTRLKGRIKKISPVIKRQIGIISEL